MVKKTIAHFVVVIRMTDVFANLAIQLHRFFALFTCQVEW
jgi:hypothetical protein